MNQRTYSMDEIVQMLEEAYANSCIFGEIQPDTFQSRFNYFMDDELKLIVEFLRHTLRMRAYNEHKEQQQEKDDEAN